MTYLYPEHDQNGIRGLRGGHLEISGGDFVAGHIIRENGKVERHRVLTCDVEDLNEHLCMAIVKGVSSVCGIACQEVWNERRGRCKDASGTKPGQMGQFSIRR